jgi:hypothetical protein
LSEKVVNLYNTTPRHIPEERIVRSFRLKNLKYHIGVIILISLLLCNTKICEVVISTRTDRSVQQFGKLIFILCFFFTHLKITSVALDAVKLSVFMPMPFSYGPHHFT